MATISVILTIISVLTAILLTVVVLIQNPKGQGGLGAIGGGVSEAMFGASAPSALVKITVALAVVFLLATLFNAAIMGRARQAKSIGDTIVVTPEAAAPVAEAAAEAVEAAAEAAPAAEAPAAN
ncbi:MAG: preprotein translocase subunit SecG [Lentisphaeria bacterium]|nr:preprotein translocase subunit SecG [Lentisphaeria bacterium]